MRIYVIAVQALTGAILTVKTPGFRGVLGDTDFTEAAMCAVQHCVAGFPGISTWTMVFAPRGLPCATTHMTIEGCN